MKKLIYRFTTLFVVLVFLVGIVWIRIMSGRKSKVVNPPMVSFLESLDKWKHIDCETNVLLLSDNIDGSNDVTKLLQFDEYVYKRIKSKNRRFDIFVTYWAAGKTSPYIVDAHTPDTCWVASGWRCTQITEGEVFRNASGKALTVQMRTFQGVGNQKEYVMFLHLLGDELFDNGGRGIRKFPSLLLWLRDFVYIGYGHSRGQLFIRVNSSIPIEDWRKDEGWKSLSVVLEELIKKNASN